MPDTGTRIQLKENKDIDESSIEWIINPYDEFALEEALRIKERKENSEVTVLSLGPLRVEKALRTALAMGADRALLIETKEKISDPLIISQALAKVITKKTPDLILTGKASIDENHSATGGMLAEELNLPHVGFVRKLTEISKEKWLCERQMEVGVTEQITLSLPALITAEKGLNEPRYPSLPNIMKAKKKELKRVDFSHLNILSDKSFSFSSYQIPNTTVKPRIISSGSTEQKVKELIQLLKENSCL